ncbi:MAG: MFS transporter, partial [Candidatus Promineifilaceae bacterium]
MSRALLAPALRSRNFRLFWLAQTISTIGTSLQVIAEGYLIYDLTNSTFWLGAVGFIALLPVVPISLAGGVLIDRLPRRKLLLATQVGLLLQASLFGLLAISGRVTLPSVIFLYFIFGALLAIDNPARRAFLVDIVERDDLANAVALNATIFNISSVVGFALGGVLIASIGVGGTMLLNALTYFFPIIALAFIRVPDVGQDQEHKSFGIAMTEGLVSLAHQPVVLGVIAVATVVGGLAYPVIGLMPAYAKDIMGVDSIGLGILLSAVALGSVLGTFGAARLGTHQRGRNLMLAAFILPLLVAGVAFAPGMAVACLALVGVGFLLLIVQSLAVTLVQLETPDRIRGRVMTIYSMLHAGSDTGGNVLIGTLAVPLGLSLALVIGSVVALLFNGITNLLVPGIRR